MLKFVKRIICLLYFDIEVRKEKNVHKNVFSVIFFSILIRVLLDTFVWVFFWYNLWYLLASTWNSKIKFSSFFTKLHLKNTLHFHVSSSFFAI